MKVLNERSAQLKFNRSFDKINQWGKATVIESATNYYVTIHILGYECPSVLDWKISKKEAANMLDAVSRIAKMAYTKGTL